MIKRSTSAMLVRTSILLLVFTVATMSVSASTPTDLNVANINEQSFTVSWTTGDAVTGSIVYGTDPANLASSAEDKRGSSTISHTHYVVLTGLTPGAPYHFDIISNGVTYDNGGTHYTAATGPTLSLPGSDIKFGQVVLSDGTTPAEGTIVYLSIGDSAVKSALVDPTGWWDLNLNSLRTADLSAYYPYSAGDTVDVFTQGAVDGTNSTMIVSEMEPAPTIIIGQTPPPSYHPDGGDGIHPPGWGTTTTATPAVTATAVSTATSGATPEWTPTPGEAVATPTKPAVEEETAPEGAEATPTNKKGITGFTAIFAIAGLLAVAYVMMRRRGE